jgi:hypothetical protein
MSTKQHLYFIPEGWEEGNATEHLTQLRVRKFSLSTLHWKNEQMTRS